jgi:hypothetical protein
MTFFVLYWQAMRDTTYKKACQRYEKTSILITFVIPEVLKACPSMLEAGGNMVLQYSTSHIPDRSTRG